MRAKTQLHTPLTRVVVKGAKGRGCIMGARWQCRHKKPSMAHTLTVVSELSLAQLTSRTWRQ
jgi:hypothetical protein